MTVKNATGFIEFLSKAFGAHTRYKIDMPGGKIGHAELTIGDSVIMVADPDEREIQATASLHLYVEDVDRVFQEAIGLGARSESEPETYFYGDRSGCVTDAWGNRWYIATHVRDVPEEELQRHLATMAGA